MMSSLLLAGVFPLGGCGVAHAGSQVAVATWLPRSDGMGEGSGGDAPDGGVEVLDLVAVVGGEHVLGQVVVLVVVVAVDVAPLAVERLEPAAARGTTGHVVGHVDVVAVLRGGTLLGGQVRAGERAALGVAEGVHVAQRVVPGDALTTEVVRDPPAAAVAVHDDRSHVVREDRK